MIFREDTITAISTPQGEGGIAVIRISGNESIPLTTFLFKGRESFSWGESNRAYHGWIMDDVEPIDEVIVTIFKKPNSYTGEDVVEISCHGGTYVSRRILELIVKRGARPAEPGEFTRRAFLNGKIDLSQAEAVTDLIRAKTEAARRVAVYQLQGKLSKLLQDLKEKLINACLLLELELDFSDEDIGFVSNDELQNLLFSVKQNIQSIVKTFDRGRVCREGLRAVITGRSNVGKSSVLNALLERERAIVAETPGTTRDIVEDVLDLEGLLLTIIDTAGIRRTEDPVEAEGVKRAEKAINSADLIIFIIDGSQHLQEEDQLLIHRFLNMKKHILFVINKIDLPIKLDIISLKKILINKEWIKISALYKENIDHLILAIKNTVLYDGMPHQDEIVLANVRHRDILIQAEKRLEYAEESLKKGMSQEFIAMDIRFVMDAMEEIIGKTTPEEILNKIFSEFCIGK